MTAARPYEPPTLYAWDVHGADAGSSGVTSDRNTAIGHVHHAIRSADSGARGQVRQVELAPDGSTRYVQVRPVGEAWLDETSGAIVWTG